MSDDVGVEQVDHVERVGQDDVDRRAGCAPTARAARRARARRRGPGRWRSSARQEADEVAGLDRLEAERVDDLDRARRRTWRSARRAGRAASSCAAGAARTSAGAARRPRRRRDSGARVREPWRARPVPFWRYGLRAAAADLAAGLGVVRAECAAGQLGGHDLVQDGVVDRRREELLAQLDAADRRAGLVVEGGLGIVRPSSRGRATLRAPGTAPLTRSRLRSASARTTRELLDGDPLVAHVAGHPRALVDTARRRARPDRAGLAVVVGAVGLGTALEVVALDVAGEAVALGDAGDVDEVARGEEVATSSCLADLVVVDVVDAELADRRDLGQVLELAGLGLGRACSLRPSWTAV